MAHYEFVKRVFAKWNRLLLLLGFFLSMLATSTYAFTLNTRVFNSVSPSATYVVDPSFTNSGANWDPMATGAASDWSNTGFFNFAYNASSPNVISAGYDPDPGVFATTTWTRSSPYGNYRAGFDIFVNTGHGHAYYDGSQGPTIPPNYIDLRSLMRHEFGHALGLSHDWSSPLMQPYPDPGQIYEIDNDSRNGAAYIYYDGNVAPEEGGHPGPYLLPGPIDDYYAPQPPFRHVGYKGQGWTVSFWPANASNNTVSWSNGVDASTWFEFRGWRITRIFTMASNRGNYEVYIDGQLRFSGSAYVSGVPRWQIAQTFEVPFGDHIMEVRNTDPNGRYIDNDGFYLDRPFFAEGSYDDMDTNVNKYLGNWESSYNFPLAHSSTVHWSNTPENSVNIWFYGSRVMDISYQSF